MVQYQLRLRKNVLTEDEQKDGWTSEGRAHLGYSYYFVNITLFLHIVNVVLINVASRQCSRKNERNAMNKHPEGLIMLY